MVDQCWCIISVTVLISFVAGNGAFEHENKNMYESKLIIKSLEEALEYLKQQPKNVTEDVILGVLIVRANLQWVFKRLKTYLGTNPWPEGRMVQILNQCRELVDANKAENYHLLKESLWEDAAGNLNHGFLNERKGGFVLPDFDSCRSIDAYLMRGTPEDSDFCIKELLTSNCSVSEYCWLSEVNGDSHSGYKTSHRLLYFQVATKMNCQQINPKKFGSIKAIKHKLCQQMLLEATVLSERPTLSLTRDIFMEQIALCGLEGFEEFASENWRRQVRNWQSYKGCFGMDMRFDNCSGDAIQRSDHVEKVKRTDSVVDDCHTHVTAVAISSLAFFLRVTLKLAFNLP